MKALHFDTGLLPEGVRLSTFRAGAVDFQVDAIGDPQDFSSSWQLLKLGDLNAIRSTITAVRYRRDQAMIAADGEDRIAIHYYVAGSATGTLGGQSVEVNPGDATVWDLTRPIDMQSTAPVSTLIVTLPRHMVGEVLAAPSYSTMLRSTPELALAADQLGYMLDHAHALPDDGAPYLGRALRDLFAVAMLPVLKCATDIEDPTAGPLFRRLCDLIDANPDRDLDEAGIALKLDVPFTAVRRTADHFGGLPLLIERRRLLAAYRLLCDPDETAPVSSIAWRCGFADLSRFSRRFRDVFEASPSDLRNFRRGSLPTWAGAYHVEKNYSAMIA